ncbi:unnamed protein product [Owenia fusiformis]|uniref:Uncharacterized protein n=1 Tax=Owenia fusiformis TaxID=6347 RepID=A0A8J1UFM0_OWEFU|nr:unnamed protein product [Owenia fusiformis]
MADDIVLEEFPAGDIVLEEFPTAGGCGPGGCGMTWGLGLSDKAPPILKAVQKGDLEKLKTLIEKENINVDSDYFLEGNWISPIHQAVICGHPNILKYLLSKGADPNKRDSSGTTALHHAAKYGFDMEPVITDLLTHGAEIDAIGMHEGVTPLYVAYQGGYKEIVELLLSKGADINSKNGNGVPLVFSNPELDMVKFAVSKGADIHQGFTGGNAVNLAIDSPYPGGEELLRYFLDEGVHAIWVENRQGKLPYESAVFQDEQGFAMPGEESFVSILDNFLLKMARKNNVKFFEKLRDNYILILNPRGADGKSVRDIATENKFSKIVDILDNAKTYFESVDKMVASLFNTDTIKSAITKDGVNINALNKRGASVLQAAINNKKADIVDFLLEHKADVNATNRKLFTALHHAVSKMDLETVEKLIKRGANLNARNIEGMTPLEIAFTVKQSMYAYTDQQAQEAVVKLVETMVKAGLDVKGMFSGQPLMHLAASSGNIPLAEYLAKNGCEGQVNATDNEGTPTLFKAITGGHIPMVEWLLNRNVDVNTEHPYHKTSAILVALESHNVEMTKYLLDNKADPTKCKFESGHNILHEVFRSKPTLDMFELFSKFSFDVNAQTQADQSTPLHELISGILCRYSGETFTEAQIAEADDKAIPMIKRLLELGAKTDLKNCVGETVVTMATKPHKHDKILKLFEKK